MKYSDIKDSAWFEKDSLSLEEDGFEMYYPVEEYEGDEIKVDAQLSANPQDLFELSHIEFIKGETMIRLVDDEGDIHRAEMDQDITFKVYRMRLEVTI